LKVKEKEKEKEKERRKRRRRRRKGEREGRASVFALLLSLSGRASIYSGDALHCSLCRTVETGKQQKKNKEKEKEKEKGKVAPLFLLFVSLFHVVPLFTKE
jgi:hypothetical protein